MDTGVRNTLLGIAAFISLILGLLLSSVMIPRPLTEEDAQRLGLYLFSEPRVITEFQMTNHLDQPVGLDDLKGQWSVVFFGFTTCPDICPTTLSVLARAMEGLDTRPQVVMVSVDPDRDTPARLAQYVPAFDDAFEGFTGSFDETVKFAEQVNIAFGKVPGPEPGSYLVDHSGSLVLVDPDGRYAGFIKSPHSERNIQQVVNYLNRS